MQMVLEHKPSGFRSEDVCSIVAEDTVRRLRKKTPQGKLVSHCPREHKKTSLLPRSRSDISLEVIRRGILSEHIIEQRTRLNSLQH